MQLMLLMDDYLMSIGISNFPYIGSDLFLPVAWSFDVQLVVFFYPGLSVLLISRCYNCVSVESLPSVNHRSTP